MKVGLIDIEPKIFNTAYMQIAYYHKQLGDTVEWAAPLEYGKYDKLYCSSIFDFTDKSQVPSNAICGGTGYSLTTELPFDCDLDYSIYPKCKTSFVWFTRGCKRKCPWCVVPEKEGDLHWVRRKQLNPKGRYITIMDNDFFGNPDWENVIAWLGQIPVDIQGIDVRTLTDAKCEALAGLRRWKNKRFKIAWDIPSEETKIRNGIIMLTESMPASSLMCYVLIGFNTTLEQDLHRVRSLQGMRIDPYVMCIDRQDRHQKKFQRWVNGHAYRNVKWEDFK